jgi:hypothetical protein
VFIARAIPVSDSSTVVPPTEAASETASNTVSILDEHGGGPTASTHKGDQLLEESDPEFQEVLFNPFADQWSLPQSTQSS